MSTLDASFVVVPRENDASKGQAQGPADVKDSYAHDWSKSATGGLRISGRHFIDKDGRVCWLRGVNLSGSSKTPSSDDSATFPNGHEHVTFVGRPFPLEEAHEHLARLRRWGLTFVRLLVTWEALEHAGPGIYDTEYLKYLQDLLSLFSEYGLVAFVSLHQDVWSRFTGGSGAPAWTIHAAGFDINALEATGAAWLKGVGGGVLSPNERGLWPCGYTKLAASTMATLFWGGETFAPKLKIDGVNIQKYLQDKFLAAWEALARAVGHLDAVVGFEMMNEPHFGYIGLPSLNEFDYNTNLHLGNMPSGLQSFALGAGHPTAVPHWTRTYPWPTKLSHNEIVNKEGKSAWRKDGPTEGQCVWEQHGVWGWDTRKGDAVVLRESYFLKHPLTNEKIDWYTDFYFPFIKRWSSVVRSASSPDKIVFTEVLPNEFCPSSWSIDRRPQNMVYAPHWYDLISLFRKEFGNLSINVQSITRGKFILRALHWGHYGARENFSMQLRNVVESSYKSLGETPTIIGETGIPMDLNGHDAFFSNNWQWQTRMMDALISGLEASLVGFTLWNYNPFNDNVLGDHWNGENFSFFSRDSSEVSDKVNAINIQQSNETLDAGGRVLRAVVRPYPAKTAGIPIRFEYDLNVGHFVYEWTVPDIAKPVENNATITPSIIPPLSGLTHELKKFETEIFVPSMLSQGRKIVVEGLRNGDSHSHDSSRQTLTIRPKVNSPGVTHRISVRLDPPLQPEFVVNDFWTDFGRSVSVALCVIVGLLAIWLSA